MSAQKLRGELVLCLIIIFLIAGIKKEEKKPMHCYNYTDLEITSSKKPIRNDLFLELANGDLLLVDSTSQRDLLISDDKGEAWDEIDTGDFSSGKITKDRNIVAAWYDRTNSKVYFLGWETGVDNDKAEVWYLDTSDYSVTTIGNSIDTVNGDPTGLDVYIRDSNLEVVMADYTALQERHEIYRWVDPNWVIQDWTSCTAVYYQYGLVVGTDFYYVSTAINSVFVVKFTGAAISIVDTQASFTKPSSSAMYGVAYDGSDLLYFILEDTDDNKNYLCTYSITGDSFTQLGEHNVSLMLDRNTASGVQEKGFHLTEYKVYQLHSKLPYQLHMISLVDSDAVLIAITDNFLMNNDGDMFEYADIDDYIPSCKITLKDMDHHTAEIGILNTYLLEKGMFIRIEDTFTSAGSTSTEIIFEGYVETFTDHFIQVARLISPAQRDLDEEFPSGDYSGRTDEIIVDLIAAYCDYITAGTMSNGTAMGTITFSGNRTLREILDELALTDNFIWYLTPEGELYYNNGSVDSVENLAETDPISNVERTYGVRAINYVDIKGGIVNGAIVSGTAQQSLEDQQAQGRNPYIRVFSHLDTSALCTTTNTNILSRYGTQATLISFNHMDSSVGLIQPGETITFQYVLTGVLPSISSDQVGIREVTYDAKQGTGFYMVSDQIL